MARVTLRRILLVLVAAVGYTTYGFLSSGCMEKQTETCLVDGNCPTGQKCLDLGQGLVCAEPACVDDADPALRANDRCDEVAGEIREIVPEAVCAAQGQVVDPETGECTAACTSDLDCDPGEHCADNGKCAVTPGPGSDYDACPKGVVYDPGADRCVIASSAGGCPGTSVDDGSGTCVKPCGAGDCPGHREVCNTVTQLCETTCTTNAHCGEGESCQSGFCGPKPCVDQDDCLGVAGICTGGFCTASCVLSGCGGFDECDTRTGLCEPLPQLNDGSTGTSAFAITGPDTVRFSLSITSGQRDPSEIDVSLPVGLTADAWVPGQPVSAVEMDTTFDGEPDVTLGAWIAQTADLAYFAPGGGGPYVEGESPVALRAADALYFYGPHGFDGLAYFPDARSNGTVLFDLPLTAVADGLHPVTVTVRFTDRTSGGRPDSLLPDAPTQQTIHTISFSPDTDGDGLPDDEEAQLGTDPASTDSDGDGLPDGEEIDLGSDPLDFDTDDDGFGDGYEESRGGSAVDAAVRPFLEATCTTPRRDFFAATATTTRPVLGPVAARDCGGVPGTDLRAVFADGDAIRAVTVDGCTADATGPTTLFDSPDVPAACGSHTSVLEADTRGDWCAWRVVCASDGQTRDYTALCDGSGGVSLQAETGTLVGGAAWTAIGASALAGSTASPLRAITGSTASGDVLALCTPGGGACSERLAASDLGASALAQGALECSTGGCVVEASGPDALYFVDLVSTGGAGTQAVVSVGDPSPFPGPGGATVSALGDRSVGGGYLTVHLTDSSGASGIVRFATDGRLARVESEENVAIPGFEPNAATITGPVDQGPNAVHGTSVVVQGTDIVSSEGLYGRLDAVPGSGLEPLVKLARYGDRYQDPPDVLQGGLGPGFASQNLISPRAVHGDTLVSRLRISGVYAIGLHRPGGGVAPDAGLLAMRPGGGSSFLQVDACPNRFRTVGSTASNSIGSGLAAHPTTGQVFASQGFAGGGGGNVYTLPLTVPSPAGSGPWTVGAPVLLGPSGYPAVPGLAFDGGGTLYASVSTTGGYADGLATIDPLTGAATLVGTYTEGGATAVEAIDALAWDPIGQRMWAFTGEAYDGTSGDVYLVDLGTAALTKVADLGGIAYRVTKGQSIAGAGFSRSGALYLTSGAGDGKLLWADRSAIGASPPGSPVVLPTYVVGDVDYASGSLPDLAVVDSDNDALLDWVEDAAGTNAVDADTDADGLDDGAELGVHGTDPLLPDSDGDGLTDGEEIAGGTDPNDPFDPAPAVPATSPLVRTLLVGVLAIVSMVSLRRLRREPGRRA
jgi:hypothetical protein